MGGEKGVLGLGKKKGALEEITIRGNRSHVEDGRKRPKKKRRVEQRG